MFELYRYHNGATELIQRFREPDRAKSACKASSAIQEGILSVRRSGHAQALYYGYRGKLGSADEIMLAVTKEEEPLMKLEPPVSSIEVEPEPEPKAEDYDLDTMSLNELRELATDIDLPGRAGLNKRDLVAALTLALSDGFGPTEHKAATQKEPAEHKAYDGALIALDDETGTVEAIVSVFGVVDDGDDIIHPGAFTKTLIERGHRVRVLDSHNNYSGLSVVGRPIEIREVSRAELPPALLQTHPMATGGLYTKTQYLLDTPEGLGIYNRIKAGALSEYSIGFDTLDSDMQALETEPNRVVRNIRSVRLWEYSPVVWGMNPATATVSVKAAADVLEEEVENVALETDNTDTEEEQPKFVDTVSLELDRVLALLKEAISLLGDGSTPSEAEVDPEHLVAETPTPDEGAGPLDGAAIEALLSQIEELESDLEELE